MASTDVQTGYAPVGDLDMAMIPPFLDAPMPEDA